MTVSTTLENLCTRSLSLKAGEPMELFAQICSMIGEVLDVPVVCLSEIKGGDLNFLAVWVEGTVHLNAGSCPLKITPCATVEHSREIQVYERVAELFPDATFLSEHQAHSYCGFPSITPEGEVLAVTCILDSKPRVFTHEERLGLQILGHRIGIELTRLRSDQERKASSEEAAQSKHALKVLAEVSRAIHRAKDEQGICDSACEIIVNQGGYRLAWMGLTNQDEDKTIRPAAQAGFEAGYLDSLNLTWADSERGRGPTGTAIRTRKPSLTRDIMRAPKFAPWREAALKRGYASSLALPLLSLDPSQQPLGALNIYASEPDAFGPTETAYLQTLAQALSTGIETMRMARQKVPLEAAIEQAGEAIMITDTRATIQYVNPAFERITGYHQDEVLGKNARILSSGRMNDSVYQDLWATITKGKTWFGRLENRRRDGSLFMEDATISPVIAATGDEIIGYVSVERDVTREIELEEQFLQSQKLEAVGQLAAGVAHDFNNLLTVIMGYASLIDPDGTSPKVQPIEQAAKRGAELTTQLLTLSRKAVAKPQNLDLNDAIIEAEGLLARVIGEDVTLTCKPAKHMPKVWVDAGHVQQIIMNLAINARDAMPEGGELTLATRYETVQSQNRDDAQLKPGEYSVLSVTDTGIGMDKETQARIFKPFFTTKDLGSGTGLGLATVLGIVKQSKGQVFVTSEVDVGSQFEVYLPVSSEVPIRETQNTVPATSSSDEVVLLVEDQADVRSLLSSSLRHAGYRVLEASCSTEAIKLWNTAIDPIQILVTDIVMPGMNGDVLADQLRNEAPALRVLFLSGYAPNPSFTKKLATPGIEFLGKPFSPISLLRKVRQVLSQSRSTL